MEMAARGQVRKCKRKVATFFSTDARKICVSFIKDSERGEGESER